MTDTEPDYCLMLKGLPREQALAVVVHELRMPVVFLRAAVQLARRSTALPQPDLVAMDVNLDQVEVHLSQLLELRNQAGSHQDNLPLITDDLMTTIGLISGAVDTLATCLNNQAKLLVQHCELADVGELRPVFEQVPVRCAELSRLVRQLLQIDLVHYLKHQS